MSSIPRVLLLAPVPNDATSYYRAVPPLNALHKQGLIYLDYTTAQQPCDWDILSRYDIVFFQRPYSKKHVDNLINALMMGLKVVIDFDDDLFSLQPDNPLYKVYANQPNQNNIIFFLNNAHFIICSTQFLADKLKKYTDNHERFVVISNALNDGFLKIDKFSHGDGIMWRGGDSHKGDLESVTEQMIRVGKEYKFSFFGYNPKFITDYTDHYHYEWKGVLAFYDNIRNRLWQVMVVPLLDNDFNRSKSKISFIEATYAGAALLAPDFDEFNVPGCTTYKDAQDFEIKLRMMINDRDYCEQQWGLAKKHIEENLLLSEVNKLRLEVLQKLN